jgi:hypothetical protein
MAFTGPAAHRRSHVVVVVTVDVADAAVHQRRSMMVINSRGAARAVGSQCEENDQIFFGVIHGILRTGPVA